MDGPAVLARFDAETRAAPPPEAGLTREWAGGVLRGLGAYNFIGWWDLTEDAVAASVAEQTAFFRARGEDVEWKVFSHDRPRGLEAALAGAGWMPQEPETFLVLDMEQTALDPVAASGVVVRRVMDSAGIEDYVAAGAAAFGRREDHWLQTLPPRLEDGSLSVWVAYDGDRAVAAGRTEFISGSAFAGLYGGGTDPAWRGKGLYRALVAARGAEARARGVRYLFVDARETSRPILERLGFEPLATIKGWMLGA
jgi:GNAT superfamily N-acetyltransferase